MATKKVDLETARRILKTDKVFYNVLGKLNYVSTGKYGSGYTIVIPDEWTIGRNDELEIPLVYRSCRKLTDNMNLDFDGDAEVMFGKSRVSQTGKRVFELTDPTKSKEVLVRVKWGGPFCKTRGQNTVYAEKVGCTAFVSKNSNGGGAGCDYWILPVGFVRGREARDVSEILQEVENDERKRIAENDAYRASKQMHLEEIRNNKGRILAAIDPMVQRIREVNNEFKMTPNEESLQYTIEKKYGCCAYEYSDQVIEKFERLATEQELLAKQRGIYTPLYQDLVAPCQSVDVMMKFGISRVETTYNNQKFGKGSYSYNEDDYATFVNDLNIEIDKIKEARVQTIRAAAEAKKKRRLEERKQECRQKGYPEQFEFHNRKFGATRQSHAYVIEADGSIREPDDNILDNRNHIYNNAWLTEADGTQIYDQILDGELIFSYTKRYTAAPLVFNIEWADRDINSPQQEVVEQIVEEVIDKYSCNSIPPKVLDATETPISDISKWLKQSSKKKSQEFAKIMAEAEDKKNEPQITLLDIDRSLEQIKENSL